MGGSGDPRPDLVEGRRYIDAMHFHAQDIHGGNWQAGLMWRWLLHRMVAEGGTLAALACGFFQHSECFGGGLCPRKTLHIAMARGNQLLAQRFVLAKT